MTLAGGADGNKGYFAESSGDLDGEIKSRIISVSKSKLHCSECGHISNYVAGHKSKEHVHLEMPWPCMFLGITDTRYNQQFVQKNLIQ